MIRLALSFSISSLVLAIGFVTAWIQSHNFSLAADLDEMQEECEWYERRISGLREELDRFEFELRVQQNPTVNSDGPGGPRGETSRGEQ